MVRDGRGGAPPRPAAPARSVYLSLVAGTEKGLTLRDNVAAFSELRFTPPRIADLPAARQQATSVLGQEISLPVIASPTGVQAVHPEGEVGRGARAPPRRARRWA